MRSSHRISQVTKEFLRLHVNLVKVWKTLSSTLRRVDVRDFLRSFSIHRKLNFASDPILYTSAASPPLAYRIQRLL